MDKTHHSDPASFYQDTPFPGRNLIAWAVGIWIAIIVLDESVLDNKKLSLWVDYTLSIVLLGSMILYLIGFWKGVAGKGYARGLFIFAFFPVLGLLLLYFLPCQLWPKNSG